ncbi:MAG: hypothetical protein U5R49_05675 [Deltaproteobacteria bacterium]|nr:hypothetical protein [Deltaproteobacteria bacterium]
MGPATKSRLAWPKVSLQFENGDGSFPSAFAQDTELSVTRRLYRSGESEYLINKVPCRLKDIQEVFMDTGLGNRSYSIIGQGQIGSIIEQKPEETRIMLEEAAGITKYRKKVAASERKIEMTQANLQRVEDILSEVETRMRSLKRQAGKARRFKTISKEIQDLELILYANTYQQLMTDSDEKLNIREALEQEEIARSTEISRLRAGIEAMDLKLQDKDEGLAACRQDYQRLRDRVHKKEAGIDALNGEMGMLNEMKARLETEREEIRLRLRELETERDTLEGQKVDTKEKARDLEKEIDLREERMKARRGLLREIKEAFEAARTELSEGRNRETGLDQKSGYLNRLLGQITDARSRLEKEREDVRAKSEKFNAASERKSAVREATASRLGDLQVAIEEVNGKLSELQDKKESIETDLKSAERALNMANSRLSSLTALMENFEGYTLGVRTIMKAKDFEPRQQGRILGILADVIQVDSRYERAVEAALGEKLQYVIVESMADGEAAVGYLKEKQKGMGSFAPVKELKSAASPRPQGLDLPSLFDVVSVPERHGPLMRTLLKDIYIADDLSQAISQHTSIQALSDTNGCGPAFVTLDGELVDPHGVISGGRLSQGSRGFWFENGSCRNSRKRSKRTRPGSSHCSRSTRRH